MTKPAEKNNENQGKAQTKKEVMENPVFWIVTQALINRLPDVPGPEKPRS